MKRKDISMRAASLLMCAAVAGTTVPIAPVLAAETETVVEVPMEGVAETPEPEGETGKPESGAVPEKETEEIQIEQVSETPKTNTGETDSIQLMYGNAKEPVELEKDMGIRDLTSKLLQLTGSSIDASNIYLDWVGNDGMRTMLLSGDADASDGIMTVSNLYDLTAGKTEGLTLILYTDQDEVCRFTVKTSESANTLLVNRKTVENLYKVTYDTLTSSAGVMNHVSKRAYGEAISHFDNKVDDWEHHEFLGWFDSTGSDAAEITESTVVTRDMVIYAHWKTDSYTLAFDSQGGSLVESRTVEFGKETSGFANPAKDGYKFLGWFDAKDGGEEVTKLTMGDSDITLYAHWEEIKEAVKYTVTLDDQNGNVDAVKVEKDYAFDKFPEPKREGYTFLGWFDAKEGGNQVTSYTATKDAVFYAQWKAVNSETPSEKAPFVISMRQNGSADVIDVKPGDEVKYAVTVRNGSQKEVKNIVATMKLPEGLEYVRNKVTEDNYESDSHYGKAQVSYSEAEHTLTMIPARYTHDTTGSLAPNRTVSFEIVMKVKEDAAGKLLAGMQVAYGDNQTQDASDLVLTVKEAGKPDTEQFTVTLDDQNGNVDAVKVEKDYVFDKFPEPKREGYTFLGWFDAKEGGNQVTSYTATKDAVFYAQWKKADTEKKAYKVTLDDQNGNVDTHEVEEGSFTNFPTPVREGYTFLGWFDAKEGGNQITSYDGGSDAVFYAQWKEAEPDDKEKLVTTLTLNKHDVTVNMTKGEKLGLTFSYGPKGAANAKFKWESSNPDVLAVVTSADSKGNTTYRFEYRGAGQAVLKVSTTDDSISDSCNVTVTKDEEPGNTDGDNNNNGNNTNNGTDSNNNGTDNNNNNGTDNNNNIDDNNSNGTDDNTVQRYTLTVISATGATQNVTVNSDVKLSDLALKLGYEVSTFTARQAGIKEYTVDSSTAMDALARLTENGDLLIIGYDSSGKAIGSAKVTKTGAGTFSVTLSKDTQIALKDANGNTEKKGNGDSDNGNGSGSDSGSGSGSGSGSDGSAPISNDGKGDSVAQSVKTGDTNTVYFYGITSTIMGALLGILAFLHKTKRI